jgi:hypothetical protein
MKTLLIATICFHLFAPRLLAQRQGSWVIRGDTTRAPRGCSASTAITTINLFLGAMRDADFVRLDKALAPKFGVSIGPLVPAHRFSMRGACPTCFGTRVSESVRMSACSSRV